MRTSLADAPRDTRWEVVAGEHIEPRDRSGALLAWMKGERKSPAIRSADGRTLTQTLPLMRVSAGDLVRLAVDGILQTGTQPVAGGFRAGIEGPALRIKDVPTGVSFAEVAGDRQVVALLPEGRLNSRMIERALSPAEVTLIRERAPLRFVRPELLDAGGTLVARVLEVDGASGWSIEVHDNFLPGVWLFSILLACRGGVL